MKKLMIGLFTFVLSFSAFAGDHPRIEEWKSEGLVYAVRDDAGRFQGWGQLELESWDDGDDVSEWVARRSDGTFVTGYTGRLEKFRVKNSGPRERTRLVIRNARGRFVTWQDMDKALSAGWERNRDGSWRYVIRYKGRFVNWSNGSLEDWGNQYEGPVLVVRDTNDGRNNGKILTWIAPEKVGRALRYRDPATGRFIATK